MQQEIKPGDVSKLMREGKLKFGMDLEFLDNNNVWTKPMVLTGFSTWGTNGFEHKGMFFRAARFPLPALRDGDPVVVGYSKETTHYKRIFKEYTGEGYLVVWDDGYSRWTHQECHGFYHTWGYGRPATKQELESAGYTEDQINEMMERWGQTK